MYWRRRLPHWIPDETIVFVTWRLAGTLPQSRPGVLKADPRPGAAFILQDRELDRTPSGPRWLGDPRVANLFVEALLYGQAARGLYDLFAWSVMPNHVHVVLKAHKPLHEVMRWLKSATASRANRLIGRTGTAFWHREYYDRWIRTEKELGSVIEYVEQNPVTAGLAASADEWLWSSAATDAGGRTASVTSEG
jgi:putative transposase